ncbi:MAG: hypothetical protein M1825_005199 [Sarcosagium campestre]|nr:MAG: hypothetical protein M1825_005199 [Sarcosagium campestre]
MRYLARVTEAERAWDEKRRRIENGDQKSILSILEERGFIDTIAGNRDDLDRLMTRKRIGVYVGFDPTAPSLHLGHLLPLMALYWLYVHGFHTITLLGGATAKIGDPTGRLTARERASKSVRKACMISMHYQLKTMWANVEQYGDSHGHTPEWAWHRELCNNNVWLNKLSVVELLQVLGPGMRMGAMLGKDTVQNKMHKGDGMSFAEFSYPVLQAWDWWHMYDTKGVQLQIGGSDQYGNIVAGIDAVKFIKKSHHDPDVRQEEDDPMMTPYGFTVPLLTTASGQKFGKSEGNAIWLDKDMTSSFDLYQYLLRLPDADVFRYLKLFTFIPIPKLERIMSQHNEDASKRIAQHLLAREVIQLVHGDVEASTAQAQHGAMFGRGRAPTLAAIGAASPSSSAGPPNSGNISSRHTILPKSLVKNKPFARVLHSAGLTESHSEAHRLIAIQGGAYVGHRDSGQEMGDEVRYARIRQSWTPEQTEDYIQEGDLLLLRVGKWKIKIIKIVEDDEFERLDLDAPGWAAEKQRGKTRAFLETKGRDDENSVVDS